MRTKTPFTLLAAALVSGGLPSSASQAQAQAQADTWTPVAQCIDKHAGTLVQIRRPTIMELASAIRSLCRKEIETWCAATASAAEYLSACYASPQLGDYVLQRLVLVEGRLQTAQPLR